MKTIFTTFSLFFIVFLPSVVKSQVLKCGNFLFYNKVEKEKNIWRKIKFNNKELLSINKGNNLLLVFDCNSINVSKDKRILLVRQIITDSIPPKDSIAFMSTYEAPYVMIDTKNDSYTSDFVTLEDDRIYFYSNSKGNAEFVDNHNLLYEGKIFFLVDDFMKKIINLIREKKLKLDIDNIEELLANNPIDKQNNNNYNNIAYTLSINGNQTGAIHLLHKILQKFPDRVVAYLNLADSYWTIGNEDLAKENYKKYVELMKSQNKDLKKIPKEVWERIK